MEVERRRNCGYRNCWVHCGVLALDGSGEKEKLWVQKLLGTLWCDGTGWKWREGEIVGTETVGYIVVCWHWMEVERRRNCGYRNCWVHCGVMALDGSGEKEKLWVQKLLGTLWCVGTGWKWREREIVGTETVGYIVVCWHWMEVERKRNCGYRNCWV